MRGSEECKNKRNIRALNRDGFMAEAIRQDEEKEIRKKKGKKGKTEEQKKRKCRIQRKWIGAKKKSFRKILNETEREERRGERKKGSKKKKD